MLHPHKHKHKHKKETTKTHTYHHGHATGSELFIFWMVQAIRLLTVSTDSTVSFAVGRLFTKSGIQRWGGILGLGHCRHLWVGHCWGWIGGHWGEWQNLKVREQRRRSLHRSLRRLGIERRPERRLPPSTTGLSMFLVGSPYCSHWDSQPAMATNQMFNVTKWICQFYLLHYFDFLYIII